MTQTNYPIINGKEDLVNFVKEITRLREIEDLPDFTNLPLRFVTGRTTDRVPSTPSNVLSTDNVGDIVTDAANGFEYKLVDNAGTFVWDRRTLDIAW